MFRKQTHKQTLENLSTSVILLDERLCIDYMNPAAEMLLEATIKRLKLCGVEQWLTSDPDELAVLKASIHSGHPYTRREAKLITFSGRELTVDYSVNPLPLQNSPMLLIEIQARDRLLRIEREEELLSHHAATRNLVRGLAHEIKNPLGGIRGAAQLLERELEDESLHEYTHIIIEEVDRLRNLVDRLLGSHKLPKLEQVNIHAVLERVCALVNAECAGQIELHRDYDPSIPEFTGDSERLIQAVLNIVRNAMQSLQENAVVAPKISLRTRAKRQVTLGSERHRLVCCLDIIDNGPGIPPEILNTVFYPMISGRADGSGLGLSIAQSIINQHHGLIECSSAPGCTRLTLNIPLE
ncbi:nitrogen regulation protein NR(II) [Neptunomonas antarctica]|uniref:histidine kinase n=1 Tax=Neptunomonas antarctica TaxID=619304 RepID=A0A1N7PNQ4_9GAMM|nr:nitrogen regulation protein NR(II) [Neptunomonas antarctica]SIT11999.1 two-component system, NtrC family, nitrogen regulation sensor histidine kinase GlnL [Neptunomonas antarctica]